SHFFHRQLKTKRPTFLPSRKRKDDCFSTPFHRPSRMRDSSLPPSVKDKEIKLSTLLEEERDLPFYPLVRGKVTSILPHRKRKGNTRITVPPTIHHERRTHFFHRLLKTKRSTFLPPYKRKGDYLSTPSKKERKPLPLFS
ncbi:hypothetical protein V8G54_024068, partial [Vigna mungo]